MPRRDKKPHEMEMYEAIMKLKDADECYRFFKDICSDHEMLAMEQRFHVAKMLDEGSTYIDIQEATNASTATISRVARVLADGTGTISTVLKEMKG